MARLRSARRPGINAAAWFAGASFTSASRASFHTFLTAPTTGPRLDAMIEDNRLTDARILAEREESTDDGDGSACGTACGYCGRCA